jgi:hypothetical protein
LNSIQSIFKDLSGNASPSIAPSQLSEGYFQVRAVQANDRGALMRPMSNGEGYSYPLKAFYQNEISIALQNTADVQPLTLTGLNVGLVCA